MSRLLIVSNRLPVTIRREGRKTSIEASPGGLATGLAGPHQASGGWWLGWPGVELDRLAGGVRADVEARLAERRFLSVHLGAEEVRRYYEGYANGVLWPTCHYLPGQLPLQSDDWPVYEAVNERFASAIAEQHRSGDQVWIHDYHLMRVPALLRARIPDVRVGFFLHIPFPSSEVFRTLPERERLLEGLLGADLIGFHIPAYMRHFATAVTRLLGVACELDHLSWRSREVRFGVFPMGIDAAGFAADAARPEVKAQVAALHQHEPGRILLGIDRLDYTKGIPRRLLAFERLLARHPELRGNVRLVQVGVPSREKVNAYRRFRSGIEELIGRIQGRFATPSWVPVHWMYRALSREELLGLYRAADVMLVTPLRDGLNLVAKEFVACRGDEDGVLVLSEFAGAAAELAEAIQVNPFDVDGTAQAFYRALTMSPEEQRSRMRGLRQRVFRNDVQRWTQRFLHALQSSEFREAARRSTPTPREDVAKLLEGLRSAERLVLLLDYDGTLVPFASTPELARPDPELIELLGALARRPDTDLHIVSGRRRETLDAWFGALPVGLHAEHGFWSRSSRGAWTGIPVPPGEWRKQVLAILEEAAANTPGSLVEEKTVGLTWHYRGADPEYGLRQAQDLQVHLTELLANTPVEVMAGAKVIEVRPHGVNKGLVVKAALSGVPPEARVVAFGDDRTDEDLFAALPAHGIAIHVGPSPSRAPWRLACVEDARALLRGLLDR